MITQCSFCQVNTAGQHEWNCPMNPNSVEVMKVRNIDYLEWHNKIQELKKENAELKLCVKGSNLIAKQLDEANQQLINKIQELHRQPKLNRQEVEKEYNFYLKSLIEISIDDNDKKDYRICLKKFINAICNLVLPEVKILDSEEVSILYDEFIEKVFNNFKEEILEGYQSFKINQEYQIISDNFIIAICKLAIK